jgi:uncharacterized membrane protein YfcA
MRLHRGVPMLAAVLTLAGSTPAQARLMPAIGDGPGQPTSAVQHQSGTAIDWEIGAGVAGIALLGGGPAATRRRRQTLGTRPARFAS